ncbi:MAG: CubicO group peptidase (beta-lactamase class C family) [Pseudohongiellaceae bacterium]|jgi:CubicO group peptidase (beta-lactamase class C family)
MSPNASLALIRQLLPALLLAAFVPLAAAQDPGEILDGLFAEVDGDDRPGCAVMVTFGGKTLYENGFGLACVEQRTPITPDTIFRIGSTSKQFTAACIGLLSLRGEVDLDAPIETWLPELTEFDPPVLLSDLVHHTSGFPDYIDLLVGSGIEMEDHVTPAETLDVIAGVQQLDFEPGTQWAYSNTNYFLLSQVVERVSGRSLRQFADDELFAPLSMEHTHYQDRWDEVVVGRANGHGVAEGGGFTKNNTRWEQVGDGGVFTSVRELALWQGFWSDPSLLPEGPALTELMLTPGRYRDGREHDYAFGLMVGNFEGRPLISHSGGWVGFVAEMLWFPEEGVGVIVLANSVEVPSPELARRVARTVLG